MFMVASGAMLNLVSAAKELVHERIQRWRDLG
jgi:hypothetical protein